MFHGEEHAAQVFENRLLCCTYSVSGLQTTACMIFFLLFFFLLYKRTLANLCNPTIFISLFSYAILVCFSTTTFV